MKKVLSCIAFIGVLGMSLAIVTKPRVKYLREGDDGTIAACFEHTLIPVFSGDIRWYHINATDKTQLPNSNAHSEVWHTGYVLKGTNVKPRNSGKYCCTVGEMETCTENATTQFVVAATPQLIIHDSIINATNGESTEMTCSHANPDTIPIRMRWYKNASLLLPGEKYTMIRQAHSYTLQVHNVTESDGGTYSCIADSLHSSQSIGTIQLTVMSATSALNSVATTASSNNPTTEQPSSNMAVDSTSIPITVSITFPTDIECELAKLIEINADLRNYLMNLCNCEEPMIYGVLFQCINTSTATYSFIIIGKGVVGVAAAFNQSLHNQRHLITDDGISLSLHSSIQQNSAMTATATPNDDSDTMPTDVNASILFALIAIVVILLGVILILGSSVGLYICWKKTEDAKPKKNLAVNNLHAYENVADIPHRPANYFPSLPMHSMHATTV